MRILWMVSGALALLFLTLFGVVEALELPILTDPSPWLGKGGSLAAIAGVGLLVGDVVLPVPSSLVMIANGALFGVIGGTVLSLAGCLGSAWLGFAIGRRGGPLVLRLVPDAEQVRARALLDRFGLLAIVISRPIPIIAETVSILAGASSLGWTRMTVAALAGAIPGALLYAVTGATAFSLDNVALVFGLVLLVAGLFWWIGTRAGASPLRDA